MDIDARCEQGNHAEQKKQLVVFLTFGLGC